MKNKKIILCLIVVLIFVLLIIGIIYYLNNRKSYILNLPELDKIASITLEQNSRSVLLSGEEEIKNIYEIIKGEGRITTESSINDIPVGNSNVIKIDFNYEDSVATIVYIYLKNELYYIEQPLNGIYELNAADFYQIEFYLD